MPFSLYDYARPEVQDEHAAYGQEFDQTEFETEHPVARIHPETGDRALVLGHFVRRLVSLMMQDSHDLCDLLQRHVVRLENTVRWNWRRGNIAIWDDRSIQLYAVDDFDG